VNIEFRLPPEGEARERKRAGGGLVSTGRNP